jgi:acyl-coenzyme A thioesterase PaaI-like protein
MSSANPPVIVRPDECCFACSSNNLQGLQLDFQECEGRARAVWKPSSIWEGFRGIIHGGLVSTVLDEAMSKAVGLSGHTALTCELRVRLKLQVKPGETLVVMGWLVDKTKRKIVAEATLAGANGQEKAHAWGVFLEIAGLEGQ